MTLTAKEKLPLYQMILGSDWERLSVSVRQAHEVTRCCRHGSFDITQPDRFLGRIIARCARMPAAGRAVLTTLHIAHADGHEVWTRTFGVDRLRSTQHSLGRRLLCERFGRLEIRFRLEVERGGIRYRQERAFIRFGGYRARLPCWISPRVEALELPGDTPTQTRVSVSVHLPIIGQLMRYEGHIDIWEHTP